MEFGMKKNNKTQTSIHANTHIHTHKNFKVIHLGEKADIPV